MSYTYRNTNTGDVYTLAERDSRLDNLPNWALVENAEPPAAVVEALTRAAAEKRAIEQAAAARLREAQEKAVAKLSAAAASAAGLAGGAVVPTGAHSEPALVKPSPVLGDKTAPVIEPAEGTTVLQRAKADQREGRTQIEPRAESRRAELAAPADEQALAGEQPKRNAAQAAWVEYAVAQGAEHADVEGLTRDELIEQFGK